MQRLRPAISCSLSIYMYTYLSRRLLLHTSPPLMHPPPQAHNALRIIILPCPLHCRPALSGFIPAQGLMFHDAGTNVKLTGFKEKASPHTRCLLPPSLCDPVLAARMVPALWSFAPSSTHACLLVALGCRLMCRRPLLFGYPFVKAGVCIVTVA